MATGPEHYREAEMLIEGAKKHRFDHEGDWQKDTERHAIADALIAEAQIHATLALAAATALTGAVAAGLYDEQPDLVEWTEAAGVAPS